MIRSIINFLFRPHYRSPAELPKSHWQSFRQVQHMQSSTSKAGYSR